jgi:parallel beta-helix repeat protein
MMVSGLDIHYAASPSATGPCIAITGGESSINDFRIYATGALVEGINISGGTKHKISSGRIDVATVAGFSCTTDLNQFDNLMLVNGTGMKLNNSDRNSLTGCRFENQTHAALAALRVIGNSTKNVIDGCTFSTVTFNGIAIENTASRNVIDGCTFVVVSGDAISIEDTASNNVTRNCTFSDVTGDAVQVGASAVDNSIYPDNAVDVVGGSYVNDAGTGTKVYRGERGGNASFDETYFTFTVTNGFTGLTADSAVHGLGSVPRRFDVSFVCISATQGYSVGDRSYGPLVFAPSALVQYGVWADSTTLYYKTQTNGPGFLLNTTTGVGFVPTNANFEIHVAAWK